MEKYQLKLFVTGGSPRSKRAIENLRRICEEQLQGDYLLEVIDVLQCPQQAEKNHILATPTVIREPPMPTRRIIGDLSDTEQVLSALELQKHPPPPDAS